MLIQPCRKPLQSTWHYNLVLFICVTGQFSARLWIKGRISCSWHCPPGCHTLPVHQRSHSWPAWGVLPLLMGIHPMATAESVLSYHRVQVAPPACNCGLDDCEQELIVSNITHAASFTCSASISITLIYVKICSIRLSIERLFVSKQWA